jgi:hypothetical protein
MGPCLSVTTRKHSGSVVQNVIKTSRQRGTLGRLGGPRHSGERTARRWSLYVFLFSCEGYKLTHRTLRSSLRRGGMYLFDTIESWWLLHSRLWRGYRRSRQRGRMHSGRTGTFSMSPQRLCSALTFRMSGNKARTRQEDAQNIERHIELVQPRAGKNTKNAETDSAAHLAEKEKIREKIKVRAAGKKVMADQILKAKSKSAGSRPKTSKLIPAEGGMGMQLD